MLVGSLSRLGERGRAVRMAIVHQFADLASSPRHRLLSLPHAGACVVRAEGSFGGHLADGLEVVPRILRLGLRLDLVDGEIVGDAAVLADARRLAEVVGGTRFHLAADGRSLVRVRGVERLEIVQHGRVGIRLRLAGHALLACIEAPGPGARLIVLVPVETVGHVESLRRREPDRVDLLQKHEEDHDLPASLRQPPFGRLPDRPHRVAADARQAEDRRGRGPGTQEKRGIVERAEREFHAAEHASACAGDGLGGRALHGLPEGIVRRQEIPTFSARLHHRARGPHGQRAGCLLYTSRCV